MADNKAAKMNYRHKISITKIRGKERKENIQVQE